MQPFDAIPRLEQLTSLDPLVRKLVDVVHDVVRPQEVADALHGTWLGHPLHPVLVQVPIGAWTSAAVLDLVPRPLLPGARRSATLLVAVGLVSAAPAVVAGWTDWAESHHEQRRVGLVHAASNALAMGLYAASLGRRLTTKHRHGRLLGVLGFTAVGVGGVLGGHMSYRQALGANHAEEVPHVIPEGWHDVAAESDVPAAGPVQLVLGTVPLVAVRDGGRVRVLSDRCSHLSGPLSQGEVADGCVTCPWHGSVFRLSDGGVVHGPATTPQPAFETRVQDGRLLVRLPGADG